MQSKRIVDIILIVLIHMKTQRREKKNLFSIDKSLYNGIFLCRSFVTIWCRTFTFLFDHVHDFGSTQWAILQLICTCHTETSEKSTKPNKKSIFIPVELNRSVAITCACRALVVQRLLNQNKEYTSLRERSFFAAAPRTNDVAKQFYPVL